MASTLDMKDITQDILASYEERLKKVQEIRLEAEASGNEARALILGFQDSRREEGAKQRQELARGKEARTSEVRGTRAETRKMLADMKDLQQEETSNVQKGLDEAVRERRVEVSKILGGFHSERQMMRERLLRELSQSTMDTGNAVALLLKRAQDLAHGFGKSRREGSRELRRNLKESRSSQRDAVAKNRGESMTRLKEDIALWQELARAKKAGVVAPQAGAAMAEREVPDLEAKLMAKVMEHTGGVTLVEIAESLGVVPIVLGRTVRNLMEKGRIRKEDKLYFPI